MNIFGKLRSLGIPDCARMTVKRFLLSLTGIRENPSGHKLSQYGSDGAPWMVRDDLLSREPLIVVGGISDDVGFENEFLKVHKQAKMLGYDPTPLCSEVLEGLSARFPGRVEHVASALGGIDGECKVWISLDESDVPIYYFWSMPQQHPGKCLKEGVISVIGIDTVLQRYVSTTVDLLKIDIEGAEYAVLDALVTQPNLPTQILVEFHYRFKNFTLTQTRDTLKKLLFLGYHLEWISPWCEEFLLVRSSA